MALLCFCSTHNGIERSSSSHRTINLFFLFDIYILGLIVRKSEPKMKYKPQGAKQGLKLDQNYSLNERRLVTRDRVARRDEST